MTTFQNEDDRQTFVQHGLVKHAITDRLPGSGINLRRFAQIPMPSHAQPRQLNFLLVARMRWCKGIAEFVEAAKLLKKQYHEVNFLLLGFVDQKDPAGISLSQINEWEEHGAVKYLGVSDDVSNEIAKADCVVLPSYREGVPRSLIEAAAIGRPIITTESVGCREVVDDHVNGYLCKSRDAQDLASKMQALIELTPEERAIMGNQSRKKVQHEFDEQIVIDRYLTVINDLIGGRAPCKLADTAI